METDEKKVEEILSRGVVDVILKDNLRERMLRGDKLRVKLGIDPTGPNIHIGRGSTVKKLKEFQDLGHQIVLIIGDGTARIGDSSDKDDSREKLTVAQIKRNEEKYLEQIGRIIDIKKTEVRHNSEWIDKLTATDWVELASLFTLQQMAERENFALRMKEGKPVGFQETLYPLLQGYDSVAIKADVEIGGTDQLFNLLAGRKVMKHFGLEAQDILTLQLLAGTDGRKMSTSWGNAILIIDRPEEKYGKMMRLPDQLIPVYMESATELPMERVEEVKKSIELGDSNPMIFKKELAFAIVRLYDGLEAAKTAEEYFKKTVQEKEIPETIPSTEVEEGRMDIKNFFKLLIKANLIKSKAEGLRLLKEGVISIGGERLPEDVKEVKFSNGVVVKVGKRRFLEIKIK